MPTRITAEAQRQFNSLPLVIQHRVEAIFIRLNEWPAVSGAKPLKGALVGHFRLRTGAYRVQFFVDGNGDPTVEKVGHRDGFYDE